MKSVAMAIEGGTCRHRGSDLLFAELSLNMLDK